MKNILVNVKNIFCIVTVILSSIMLIEYLITLLPLQSTGFLFAIFDFFMFFLYFGVFCVPVLFIVSTILMVLVRVKHKDYNSFKILNIVTIFIPIILAALMLLTDFNARLQ